MADELIDILDDNMDVITTCLKSKAHKKGWLHPTVHIWLYTNTGDLLFQKRSKDKIVFPDLWDISVAGHIGAGEDEISAVRREFFEEIGLQVVVGDLFKIGTFIEKFQHGDEFIDNEIHHIYLYNLITNMNLLKIQKEELSELRLIHIEEFERLRNELNFETTFVPHQADYYDFILNEIRLKLLEIQ